MLAIILHYFKSSFKFYRLQRITIQTEMPLLYILHEHMGLTAKTKTMLSVSQQFEQRLI